VTLLSVVVIVAACYVGVMLFFSWTDSVTKNLQGIGQGFEQLTQSIEIGGTAADAAASVASSQPPGSLSVSELNAALPKYEWVVGAANVPYSSPRRPVVGVNIVGSDIETAVQSGRGSCSFGLSVSSKSDPLITEDDLPGPGTYYQAQTTQCVAELAPTSGWQAWLGTP
jgi:hypothetical protein